MTRDFLAPGCEVPQFSNFNNSNIAKLERQLGSLLAERNEILKGLDTGDEDRKEWYSVRLRHIDDVIHATRNVLFIERNSML